VLTRPNEPGAIEHRLFAGKLERSRLKLRERMMVGALHAPEGDFRDWGQIRQFGLDIATHILRD
jgi:menaquinone-dependent protoporphyrinogen oxidase